MVKKRFKKPGVFNSINIFLIALLFVELILVGNWIATGNPVRNAVLEDETSLEMEINPAQNDILGEPKFNGYIIELNDEPVYKYYNHQKNSLAVSTNIKQQTNSYRANIINKQAVLEGQIKTMIPSAKFGSKTQNVFNGLAVFDVSEGDIEQIKSMPEVKAVYPNYEVYTTLMDSVPLINADDVWNIQINGTNLTGEGVTIGIIDSGIDYSHEDFGSCSPSYYEAFGNQVAYSLRSPEIYHNQTWEIKQPGFTKIAVHFPWIYLEGGQCDYLEVIDGTDNLLWRYYGNLNDIWSPTAIGDTIKIKLVNGCSIDNYHSFSADYILNGSAIFHPFYEDCSKIIGGYDFVNNYLDPIDYDGHGTHVASIAAGNGELKGVAPNAKIYSYKATQYGSGSESNVILAIERAMDPNQDGDFSDHLDIISMSLGGYGDSNNPLSRAVDNAVNLGIIAVVSAGNSGPSGGQPNCRHTEDPTGATYSICSPGTSREAITVASSTKGDTISGFSSRGPTINGITKPDITAPGSSICAAKKFDYDEGDCYDDSHVLKSGTSMAAPMVSGVAALIKQAHPGVTPEQVKQTLKNSAKNIGYNSYTQGAGRINISSYPVSCTDTDDGKTYSIKGIVNSTNTLLIYGYQDICTTSNNLKEYYCQNNQASYIYYYCAYGCSVGKCNPNQNPPPSCYYDKFLKKKVCPGTPVA